MNTSDLVEYLQRILKTTSDSSDNNLFSRSDSKGSGSDPAPSPAGGNPLLNFNFMTLEKYPTNTRRRYEVQVMDCCIYKFAESGKKIIIIKGK